MLPSFSEQVASWMAEKQTWIFVHSHTHSHWHNADSWLLNPPHLDWINEQPLHGGVSIKSLHYGSGTIWNNSCMLFLWLWSMEPLKHLDLLPGEIDAETAKQQTFCWFPCRQSVNVLEPASCEKRMRQHKWLSVHVEGGKPQSLTKGGAQVM